MKIWRYLLVVCLTLMMGAANAQEEKIVPASRAEPMFSYAPVVKKAAPAVVNIYTHGHVTVMQNTSPFANDPFFKQFFGQQNFAFAGRPRDAVISSLGSGVIIKPDGMIVTSHHVIKDAQQITVVLSDKREFEATVIIKDPESDLAFLKIKSPEPLPYLELRDSDTIEIGDLVLAIGNPFGVGQTVTNGIVSALARKAAGVSDYQFFIQTDAAINPGNSGGALVDMQGRLVGVNTAIYSTSGGSHGIGFAIPANMVRSLAASKIEDGHVVRPWIGLSVQPVTPEIAESMGLKSPQGVLVKKIMPDSPAEKSGIKVGDIITAINGTEIGSEQDMQYRMALTKIDENSAFKILRGGSAQEIQVKPAPPPEIPKRDAHALKGRNPLSGVTVANLSPALAMELGVDESLEGVVVMEGGSGAAGINVGFQRGDMIVQVNGTKITSTEQLEKLLKTPAQQWQIVYMRGGNTMNLTVRM